MATVISRKMSQSVTIKRQDAGDLCSFSANKRNKDEEKVAMSTSLPAQSHTLSARTQNM